jgi:O-antigen ligase
MAFTWGLVYLRSRERLFSIAMCLAILGVTGARTGLFISVFVAALYAVLRKRGGSPISHVPPKVFACSVAFGISATATYLIFNASSTTFSNRGNIWSAARPIIEQAPLTGVGLSAWTRLQDVGVLPQHFSHSEYLMVIFSGGYIGLGLFTLLVAAMLHVGRRSISSGVGDYRHTLPVIAFALYGTTEVVWNPLAIDGFTWIFVLIALAASTSASLGPQDNSLDTGEQRATVSTSV